MAVDKTYLRVNPKSSNELLDYMSQELLELLQKTKLEFRGLSEHSISIVTICETQTRVYVETNVDDRKILEFLARSTFPPDPKEVLADFQFYDFHLTIICWQANDSARLLIHKISPKFR